MAGIVLSFIIFANKSYCYSVKDCRSKEILLSFILFIEEYLSINS